MTHSHPTPDQPLTPSLFQQIQSLFLLQHSPIQLLYSQFKLSLTLLFSILHDHTTLTLRRAIDEHTYLCAQRAHLELILETENVAVALAKTENPTQEQRRRLGTLNATLKTSFKNLQALRESLFGENTDLGDPHTTPKPTHTKRTTTRRTPTPTTTPPHTTPTPTTPRSTPPHTHPNTQSIYNNAPNTTPHTNQYTPTPTATPTLDPRWLPVLPLLTPQEQRIIPHIEPDTAEDLFQLPPQHIATAIRHSLSVHPEALNLDLNPDLQAADPTS
jgi:hypothetical protein